MSRHGPCSPGLKPSVPSSRPPPGGIVVGLADAGTSTRSSSFMAPPSGTSTTPSMSTARWSTCCFASAGTWHPPRHSSAAPGDRRDPASGHRHRSPSALRQGSPAEPARLAAHSDRPPSSERRDHQTDRAQPHRDPRSTASLSRPQDHGDRSAIPRRVRGDARSAKRGCRSAVSGAGLPSPIGHPRRPYACCRRRDGYPGGRAEKGRLTVTPRRSSRFKLP